MKKKTIRLIFPQWQGGVNPNYFFGSRILSLIAPDNTNQNTIKISVSKDFKTKPTLKNGYYYGDEILKQQEIVMKILDENKPDKIITFGGDCSVSQVPFDYLNGKYSNDLGVLWIDAHPDISTPDNFTNTHAMVLGNLLGDGAPELKATVKNFLQPEKIFYAGLIADKMLPYEKDFVIKKNIKFATPNDLKNNNKIILDWIKEQNIKHIAIHFDLDVLISDDFRSLLYNEPYLGEVSYATGKMKLKEILEIIKEVQDCCDIVGLTFAEYMPWDLINLNKFMNEINIFKE